LLNSIQTTKLSVLKVSCGCRSKF